MSKYVGTKCFRLSVLEQVMIERNGKNVKYFKCRCECGVEKLVHGDGIRKRRIKSCGCWKKEVDASKAKNMGQANYKHGMSHSRIYKIWDGMIQRCTNPNMKDFKHYGGRGITVDPSWFEFTAFYEDMAEGYQFDLTIERVDVNGNYEKSNCTWIPMSEQASNKRSSLRNKKKFIRRRIG